MIRTSKTTTILLYILCILMFVEVTMISQILTEVKLFGQYIETAGLW
jgi:hypothetical protein